MLRVNLHPSRGRCWRRDVTANLWRIAGHPLDVPDRAPHRCTGRPYRLVRDGSRFSAPVGSAGPPAVRGAPIPSARKARGGGARRGWPGAEWLSGFHHPHHRPTRPDVTGPPARFPIFLRSTPITLSGSRRSERPSVSGAGWPFRHCPARSPDPRSHTRARETPATTPHAGRFGHTVSQRKDPPRLRGGP